MSDSSQPRNDLESQLAQQFCDLRRYLDENIDSAMSSQVFQRRPTGSQLPDLFQQPRIVSPTLPPRLIYDQNSVDVDKVSEATESHDHAPEQDTTVVGRNALSPFRRTVQDIRSAPLPTRQSPDRQRQFSTQIGVTIQAGRPPNIDDNSLHRNGTNQYSRAGESNSQHHSHQSDLKDRQGICVNLHNKVTPGQQQSGYRWHFGQDQYPENYAQPPPTPVISYVNNQYGQETFSRPQQRPSWKQQDEDQGGIFQSPGEGPFYTTPQSSASDTQAPLRTILSRPLGQSVNEIAPPSARTPLPSGRTPLPSGRTDLPSSGNPLSPTASFPCRYPNCQRIYTREHRRDSHERGMHRNAHDCSYCGKTHSRNTDKLAHEATCRAKIAEEGAISQDKSGEPEEKD